MSAPVVLIGNDVHAPLNEMATWQVENIRRHFELAPAQVISLQSRKPVSAETSRTILRGESGLLSRLRQLFLLFRHLHSLPKDSSRIIHFVGNGKQTLRFLLSVFASMTGRKLLLSPFGKVLHGPLAPHVSAIAIHAANVPSQDSGNWHVIAPYSSRRGSIAKKTPFGPLLFSSVPPKASELAERGLPFLLRSFALLRQEIPDAKLLILNRYAWMEKPLEDLRRETAAKGVEIRSEYISDISDVLNHVSLLVIPFSAPHLPQVPLSAVEALAAGVPCLVASELALGADLLACGAGRTFSNEEEFVQAVAEIRAHYDHYSAAALRMAEDRFDPAKCLSALAAVYSVLAQIEILPNDSSMAPTHETHRSNSMF